MTAAFLPDDGVTFAMPTKLPAGVKVEFVKCGDVTFGIRQSSVLPPDQAVLVSMDETGRPFVMKDGERVYLTELRSVESIQYKPTGEIIVTERT